MKSPSPRRAWIEIDECIGYLKQADSRPPHGGRGLKSLRRPVRAETYLSPSPRRAWIEIAKASWQNLLVGSPSPRRAWIEMDRILSPDTLRRSRPPHGGRGLKFLGAIRLGRDYLCRPPHGGRGLKCDSTERARTAPPSPSPRRAWIEIFPQAPSRRATIRRPPHGGRGLK